MRPHGAARLTRPRDAPSAKALVGADIKAWCTKILGGQGFGGNALPDFRARKILRHLVRGQAHQRVPAVARAALAAVARGASVALTLLGAPPALLLAQSAQAHPVTYPGNLMTMIEADRNWTDLNAWYTFAPSHAFGGGFTAFKNDDIDRVRRIPNLHYNYRLARWNLPDAQANIYVQQGAGLASGSDFPGRRWTYMPGVQADYETQKVFVKYAWHGFKSNAFMHHFHNAQAGAAFVVGDYDANSHWAILDWRKTTHLGAKDEWTPTYRLINKTVFFELGLVNGRINQPRFTLMLNF